MAVEVAAQQSLPKRLVTFWHEVVSEMKRVTWPDRPQVIQLSIGVIGLSLFIGGVIWALDMVFSTFLVRLVPSLFGA